MMRNLIVLGCAGLLAIGLSLTGYAGVGADDDSDGVPNAHDNCSQTANGPLAATVNCDAQEDGDLDGYGNPCDTDTNNNGAADLNDITAVNIGAKSSPASTDPNLDFNCNGAADLNDITQVNVEAKTSPATQPGPSGLACAGAAPCP